MSGSVISGYPVAPPGDQTWINIAGARQSQAASQLAMDRLRAEGGGIKIDQQGLSKAIAASQAADAGATPGDGLYIMA
jgi:hypothetical protein